MPAYIYDGTLEGFFSCVFEAFQKKELPEKIESETRVSETLFTASKRIITDYKISQRVYQGILDKLNPWVMRETLLCFYSEIPGIEVALLKYLKKLFAFGPEYQQNQSDEQISVIHKTARKVSREIHQLKGFIRFQKLKGGMLFAPIEPDFAVISFLAPHFSRRLSAQDWIICDMKRKTAVIYQAGQQEWQIIESLDLQFFGQPEINIEQHLAEDEKQYQELWKEYFVKIAIRERKNPRLQRQFMQQRYWKNLTEKQNH